MLLLIFGTLMLFELTALPVAFAFLMVNVIMIFSFCGGVAGLEQLTLSLFESIASFVLICLPLFVLMGEIIFRSGVGIEVTRAVDAMMGRLPGRLSLVAVGTGAVLGTLTGADMATVAILGGTLEPEMEARGYKKSMTLGPILGCSGLAIMIPPSGLAIIVGSIGEISIAGMLVGILIPAVLMVLLFSTYIIARCKLQPSIAPSYIPPPAPISEKLLRLVKNVLPVGGLFFLVVGVIIFGIATPTEGAATGAFGCFVLAAAYRKLNWPVVKEITVATLEITVMIFMILAAATAFAQVLAYTGASRGLIEFATSLSLAPILLLIAMQIVVIFMGMFMEIVSIIMVTLPLFMPVVLVLGFNPVWFGVIFLLNITMASISPPFGLGLFVMKGVASHGTTMGDIYRAALPFLALDLVAMALMIAFPQIVLWLPGIA